MRDNESLTEPQNAPDGNRSRSPSPCNSSSNGKRRNKRRSESRGSSCSRSRSRGSADSELDGYRLHIADIGDDVRKSDLEKFFSQFGILRELWMTNSAPCFGFAVYKDKKSAAAALKGADGAEFGGNRIRVSNARPRTRGSGRRFFNPNMRCYQCGYSGHFYRDCPELGSGKDMRYDSHYDRHSSRRRRDRDRDYYSERDYGRRRSSRHYDDYGGGRRSSRRNHRY